MAPAACRAEGIYWASVAYIGGLYTQQRAASIQNEWLLATPDASMAVEPPGVANAISLQAGSPDLYALVADTTSVGHAWLPAIMPDGRYNAGATAAWQINPGALAGVIIGGIVVLGLAIFSCVACWLFKCCASCPCNKHNPSKRAVQPTA